MLGRIQQIQSFSTLDGPGTRCVVFLQGCTVGCVFCHNPESWSAGGGEEMDADEIIRRIERYKPFLQNPGLTISGGEPMCQSDFVIELIQKAKSEGWHVALDTSGAGGETRFASVASLADLIIFSIKHPLDPQSISRQSPSMMHSALRALKSVRAPVWVRYVLIPGLTDSPEALKELGNIISGMPTAERVDILPFNILAAEKWKRLNIHNPLFENNLSVSEEQIRIAEGLLGVYPYRNQTGIPRS